MCGCNPCVCTRTNRMRLNQSISGTCKDTERPAWAPLPCPWAAAVWAGGGCWLPGASVTPRLRRRLSQRGGSAVCCGEGESPEGQTSGCGRSVLQEWSYSGTPPVGGSVGMADRAGGHRGHGQSQPCRRGLREGRCARTGAAGTWVEPSECCDGNAVTGPSGCCSPHCKQCCRPPGHTARRLQRIPPAARHHRAARPPCAVSVCPRHQQSRCVDTPMSSSTVGGLQGAPSAAGGTGGMAVAA